MFESDQPIVYERVYDELTQQIKDLDMSSLAAGLGAVWENAGLVVPFFGQRYHITSRGVENLDGTRCPVTKRIILCYYVIHGGDSAIDGTWVAYRDFKDSAFFMSSFKSQVEIRIAQHYTGRLDSLRGACDVLGGEEVEGPMKGDLCVRFAALPRVPMLLIFYDGDEDLPASATVLFDQSAHLFLDMECLAVLGWVLADDLIYLDGRTE
jgi:hypothetical protein